MKFALVYILFAAALVGCATKSNTPIPSSSEGLSSEEYARRSLTGAQADDGKWLFFGHPISMTRSNADLAMVLDELVAYGGVSSVRSGQVRGPVTVRLNEVPWDQALNAVLQAAELGVVVGDRLARFDAEQALRAEREALRDAKRTGEPDWPRARFFPLVHVRGAELIPSIEKMALSASGFAVPIQSVNGIYVWDFARDLEIVRILIEFLDDTRAGLLAKCKNLKCSTPRQAGAALRAKEKAEAEERDMQCAAMRAAPPLPLPTPAPIPLTCLGRGTTMDPQTYWDRSYLGPIGIPVSADFRNVDIRAAFLKLTELGDGCIVVGPDVRGTVDMKLRDVPWDEALETMAQAVGVELKHVENVVVVVSKARAERERKEREKFPKREMLEDTKLRFFPLENASAEEIAPLLQRSVLSERGRAAAVKTTNVLVVEDDTTALEKVVHMLEAIDRPRRK